MDITTRLFLQRELKDCFLLSYTIGKTYYSDNAPAKNNPESTYVGLIMVVATKFGKFGRMVGEKTFRLPAPSGTSFNNLDTWLRARELHDNAIQKGIKTRKLKKTKKRGKTKR